MPSQYATYTFWIVFPGDRLFTDGVNMREPLPREAVIRNLLVIFFIRFATCECIRLFSG
jgi:hypothetical protein